MNIDTDLLKKALIEMKSNLTLTLERAKQPKVKHIIASNISMIESFLIWIYNTEKTGEINMDSLKIGLGKTVKLSDIEMGVRSKLDAAIIEEAKFLKETGDARPIDPNAVNVTYFVNRVYQLAREGRIHRDAKPVRTRKGELYIALKHSEPRRRKKEVNV